MSLERFPFDALNEISGELAPDDSEEWKARILVFTNDGTLDTTLTCTGVHLGTDQARDLAFSRHFFATKAGVEPPDCSILLLGSHCPVDLHAIEFRDWEDPCQLRAELDLYFDFEFEGVGLVSERRTLSVLFRVPSAVSEGALRVEMTAFVAAKGLRGRSGLGPVMRMAFECFGDELDGHLARRIAEQVLGDE